MTTMTLRKCYGDPLNDISEPLLALSRDDEGSSEDSDGESCSSTDCEHRSQGSMQGMAALVLSMFSALQGEEGSGGGGSPPAAAGAHGVFADDEAVPQRPPSNDSVASTLVSSPGEISRFRAILAPVTRIRDQFVFNNDGAVLLPVDYTFHVQDLIFGENAEHETAQNVDRSLQALTLLADVLEIRAADIRGAVQQVQLGMQQHFAGSPG